MKNLNYVKRTGRNGKYRYWYWSEKHQALVKKPDSVKRPSKEEIDAKPKYDSHPTELEREFQVRDVVYHYSQDKFGVLNKFEICS